MRKGMSMSNGVGEQDASIRDGASKTSRYYKRDFWASENLVYARPHFRLEKCARIVNKLACGRDLDLLDVGCGPATLQDFLAGTIRYHGIDIAIQSPAPNLIESDLMENAIEFRGMRFDIVVAQGFFEYAGQLQEQKFAEIGRVLPENGTFIVTYVNFSHRDRQIYWPYSNVQPQVDFRDSLCRHFDIVRCFPSSHNWQHSEPRRRFMTACQMRMDVNIPLIGPRLAVEYFYICKPHVVGSGSLKSE